MGFYDELAIDVDELLNEFGQSITFTRVTGQVKNPVTGAITSAGTTITHTPNCVTVPVNARLIDGTRIKAGDKVIIVDSSFEPLMSDKVDGYTIQEIEYKKPTDILLCSFVRVRK